MAAKSDENHEHDPSTPEYDDPHPGQALPDPVPDTDAALDSSDRKAAGGDMELVDEDDAPAEAGDEEEYEYEYVEEIVEVEVDEDGNTISENVTSTTRSARPEAPGTSRPVTPPSVHTDAAAQAEGSVDDPTAAAAAAFASSASDAAANRPVRRPPVRSKGNDNIKSTFAPVLLTVGLLVMIPAIWAVLILQGYDHFIGMPLPGADRMDEAKTMAYIMLVCWLVGPILLIAGVVMLVQVMKNRAADKAAE